MTINKIHQQMPMQNYAKNSNKTQQNPTFKGRTDVLKYALHIKNPQVNTNKFKKQVGYYLDVTKGLSKYTKPIKRHKMDLLLDLSKKYYFSIQNKTATKIDYDKNIVFAIYDKIKYPTKLHKTLTSSKFDLKQIKNIIDLTENKSYKIKLAQKLLDKHDNIQYETLENFLKSPLAKKINKNYDDYTPFINMKISNKDVVQELEKAIQKGYDKKYYTNMRKVVNLKNQYCIINAFNTETLVKNYTEERYEILNRFGRAYININKNEIKDLKADSQILENIYNTTTKENAPYRQKVLRFVERYIKFEDKKNSATIDTLVKIFSEISTNKKAKLFIDNNSTKHNRFVVPKGIHTLDELLTAMKSNTVEEAPKNKSFFQRLFKNS